MNNKLAVGIAVFAILAGAAGYKLLHQTEKGITATGTIEVTRADVTAKVGGYITGLSIIQGDRVNAGQVVATIDRKDLTAQQLRDELAVQKAAAQLTDLEKGARDQERQELLANIASAQSVLNKAQSDFNRYQALYNQGAVATQQLDSARSAYEVANSQVAALEQKLSLLNAGNRPDVIEAQRLELERSKAVAEASKILAQDMVVLAPLDGLVLSKNFENNEYVNPGVPIATLGDLNDCWVKVYVASTQIGLISYGQAVDVRVDSFPDRTFNGTIKEISQTAEFTPRQSITQRERANQVFAVKVKIDNAESLLKPGMPADVVIE